MKKSIPPQRYSQLSAHARRKLRKEYEFVQRGICIHCNTPLSGPPPSTITSRKIDLHLFPPGFLKWPQHLHHDHDTDMTIGVVHAYCNAVLWQYHGK